MDSFNNLRVLIIGTIPPPVHGSNLYMKNFINRLDKFSVNYYHLDISDHRDINNLGKIDFTNIYLGMKSLIDSYIIIKKYKPNVIYCNHAATLIPFIRDGLIILTCKKFSITGEKIKIFTHLHSGFYFRTKLFNKSNLITKKIIKYMIKYVDVALVLGAKLKKNYEDLVDKVRIAPVGTDFMLFSDPSPVRKTINICYLGNLYKSKGVELLFNSSIKILKNYKNIHFKFAGSWIENEKEMNSRIREKINNDSLNDNIRFLGKLTEREKLDFFYKCDIFVFPT
jgi:glycosyltransferase involved in cell wall biosynthesis